MSKKLYHKIEDAKLLVKKNPELKGIASDEIIVKNMPIKIMVKHILDDQPDYSGWTFLAGTETQEDLDDVKKSGVYTLNFIANYDSKIVKYLGAPTGTTIEFDETDTPVVSH